MPSRSQAQHDLMLRACNSEAFAKKVRIDQKVACEFVEADKQAGIWQDDQSAIQAFIACAPDTVKKNIEVVRDKDALTPFMLHLTLDKNPSYVPRIGFRQADSEDRTTPRVTVADTIVGCYVGYSSFLSQFMAHDAFMGGKQTKFNNGLYIRKIPFKYALRPNSKLVYDQRRSNEHWLVNYSPETAEYESELIGKIFLSGMTVSAVEGSTPDISTIFFLSLEEKTYLTTEILLDPGKYCVEIKHAENLAYNTRQLVTAHCITDQEFNERKRKVASKLSAHQPILHSHTVKKPGLAELPSWKTLSDELSRELPDTYPTESNETLLRTIEAGSGAWVAVDQDGFVIAELTFSRHAGKIAIKRLGVALDHRKCGIGAALLKMLINYAMDTDCTGVCFSAYHLAGASKEFFSRQGFIVDTVGELSTAQRMLFKEENNKSFFKQW